MDNEDKEYNKIGTEPRNIHRGIEQKHTFSVIRLQILDGKHEYGMSNNKGERFTRQI